VPAFTIALLVPTCTKGPVVPVIDPELFTPALLPNKTGPVIAAVESAVSETPLERLE